MSGSPAFQFYPAEFLADANVVMMNNRELGCYMKLLCFCWREGSIPSEISKIAKLCGEDGTVMAQLWVAISSCFGIAIDDPSKLVHPRLEKERQKQEEHRKERSESGLKGANSRWNKDLQKDGSANGSAIKQPMAKNGSSSSSSSSSSSIKNNTSVSAFAVPDWIDKPTWELWLKTRKGKKMIPEQMEAQIKKLAKWRDAGLDYGKALADAAEAGWQGLVEPKIVKSNSLFVDQKKLDADRVLGRTSFNVIDVEQLPGEKNAT